VRGRSFCSSSKSDPGGKRREKGRKGTARIAHGDRRVIAVRVWLRKEEAGNLNASGNKKGGEGGGEGRGEGKMLYLIEPSQLLIRRVSKNET